MEKMNSEQEKKDLESVKAYYEKEIAQLQDNLNKLHLDMNKKEALHESTLRDLEKRQREALSKVKQ